MRPTNGREDRSATEVGVICCTAPRPSPQVLTEPSRLSSQLKR